VEATAVGKSFQEAWRLGAGQYRDWALNGVEGFYPAEEAAAVYVPVTLEESGWEPSVPDKQLIAGVFGPDIDSFINREIQEKVGSIQEALAQDQQNPRLYNKLGILYARFRRLPEAVEAFRNAIRMKAAYPEAFSNLGSVYYMMGDFDEALIHYERAGDLLPEEPRVKINMARAHYSLGNYGAASKYYGEAVSLDARLEAQYAYLGGSAEGGGARASEVASEPTVVWEWD
jgi:tetratricopeptide (TPR) repeat protein